MGNFMSKYINMGNTGVNLDYYLLMEKKLDPQLFKHSTEVANCAAGLARVYGEDQDRAFQAGLLHDYGKRLNPSLLREEVQRLGIKLDKITLAEPQLLHAPVGAALVREELGVEDGQILRAIMYHTTGSPCLGLLEKIIYLADVVEEGRDYPGVEKLRELSYKDLHMALLTAVDNSIRRVMEKGRLLHPLSVFFRNELLLQVNEGKRR